LVQHVAVQRLAAFGNVLFSAFAPGAFGQASALASTIFKAGPHLQKPFPSGPWTSATFDIGPQTVTKPQWLCNHLRWCWLAITALGDFDPRLGGHLVLWNLGRVLEFPPGCTILIPSILCFSITGIQPGETRYSFTQYFAAG
ncbi:hypothetical protein DFH06DRAFT_935326, partial [Mycena polygramma]